MTRVALFALSSLLLAPAALADVAPPPGYVEQCTVSKQQKDGLECTLCTGAYHGAPDHCVKIYEPQGLTRACRTRGASVWKEVWCRKAGGPPIQDIPVAPTPAPEPAPEPEPTGEAPAEPTPAPAVAPAPTGDAPAPSDDAPPAPTVATDDPPADDPTPELVITPDKPLPVAEKTSACQGGPASGSWALVAFALGALALARRRRDA